MIMTDTKQCRTCIYGVKCGGIYICERCFEKDGYINQDRIPNRTENKCFDYEKRGKKKMNAIIVEKKEETAAAPVVENAVDTVEKSDEKPKKHKWTDEDTQTLIHFYNKGTKYVVLADMFGVPKERLQQKIYDLKKSEQWKGHFTDSTTISKTETVAEPETVTAELSPITAHIKDLKAYFADFVIEKCKREVVPDAVEFIGAYIKYLEEKVNE